MRRYNEAFIIWQALWLAMVRWVIRQQVHDVPTDVLAGILHWLRKGGHTPVVMLLVLDKLRGRALEGGPYCRNEGCEVVGHLKDFKVCPQCKHARYCGGVCQKQDWTTGGHRETCGKFMSKVK